MREGKKNTEFTSLDDLSFLLLAGPEQDAINVLNQLIEFGIKVENLKTCSNLKEIEGSSFDIVFCMFESLAVLKSSDAFGNGLLNGAPVIVLAAEEHDALTTDVIQGDIIDFLVVGQFGPALLNKTVHQALQNGGEHKKISKDLVKIFKLTPTMLFFIDSDSNVQKANNFFFETLQIEEDDLPGLRFSSLITPQYRAEFNNFLASLDTKSDRAEIDVPIVINGNSEWINLSATNYDHDRLYFCSGKIISLEQDVNLLQSHVINSTNDLIWVIDDDFRLMLANKSYLNKMNELYGRHYSIGDTVLSAVSNTDNKATNLNSQQWRQTYGAALQGIEQHYTISTKDIANRTLVHNISMYPIKKVPTDDSSVVGVACFAEDITEKRAIEKRIQDSERRYSGLFQRMNEGFIYSDELGTILSVNPGICKILGYREQDLVGQKGYELLHDKETATKLRNNIASRKNGHQGLYETVFLNKNGQEVLAQVSATPEFDTDGDFKGIMSIVLDITEQRKAELKALELKESFTRELEREVHERTRELEGAQKELAASLKKEQELGRMKSRFVSTASHQFRTPLSIIQSSIGILSMQMHAGESFQPDTFKTKFESSYGRIKEQIECMTNLMDDVLILGKINEGNIPLRMISQPIVPVCKDILDNFANISQRNPIELLVKGEPRAVEFDKQLLEHAISNLISNAIKYTPDNKIPAVEIRFSDTSTEIRVRDEGIGIPERELDHCFEPFYRASNVSEYSGTGLGTAIAKEYIELIGGTISVKSRLGEGTEFVIQLNN